MYWGCCVNVLFFFLSVVLFLFAEFYLTRKIFSLASFLFPGIFPSSFFFAVFKVRWLFFSFLFCQCIFYLFFFLGIIFFSSVSGALFDVSWNGKQRSAAAKLRFVQQSDYSPTISLPSKRKIKWKRYWKIIRRKVWEENKTLPLSSLSWRRSLLFISCIFLSLSLPLLFSESLQTFSAVLLPRFSFFCLFFSLFLLSLPQICEDVSLCAACVQKPNETFPKEHKSTHMMLEFRVWNWRRGKLPFFFFFPFFL